MNEKPLFFIFLLLFLVQPTFPVKINVDKSFYEPGETVTMEVSVENVTSLKECLKTMDIVVRDSQKVLCTISSGYPSDTECIEAGEEKTYTFSCVLPSNALEGVAQVEVDILMWSTLHVTGETFFEIHINYPPEITVMSCPSVVNPSTEESITFSVTDNFGVEDLDMCDVSLYHDATAPSERELYQVTWKKPHLYTVWEGDPVIVEVSLQNTEVVWTLHFSLSEVASPGEWTLEIQVYDTNHQSDQAFERFTVTKYVSFRVEDNSRSSLARINFGKASPGEELPRVLLHVVVTSNTGVNVFVEASSLHSSEGGVLPVNAFFVEGATGMVQLDGSRQVVYTTYAEKGGFNREARIQLVFWGKLPEVVQAGTYSGTWYIIVEAV